MLPVWMNGSGRDFVCFAVSRFCTESFWMLLIFAVMSTRAETHKLTRDSVIGVWSGIEATGLRCRVEFQRSRGSVFTFREEKHLTTVHFWWNIDRSGTNIVLGVSGNAHVLKPGELQLKLRPVNTNLVSVRDVVLKRVESAKPAKSSD